MRNILGILTKIYDIMSNVFFPVFSGFAEGRLSAQDVCGKAEKRKDFLSAVWNFKMMCYIMYFNNENTIQEIMIWQTN